MFITHSNTEDRQNRALTVTGSHFVIGFKSPEGRASEFIAVGEGGGGREEGRREK